MSCCTSEITKCETLKIVKDTDVVLEYTLTDDSGVAIDITGYLFYMGAKAYVSDSDYLFDLSSTDGDIVIIDAASGRFDITIAREDTASITTTQGVYDIQYTDASLNVGVFRQLSTIYFIEGVTNVP